MADDEVNRKILKYEHFLNEILKGDLKKLLDARDQVYSETAEYLQLRTVIDTLQHNPSSQKNLKTKIDLGCNFYCQANVPDASMIIVDIGHGFYIEYTLEEAIKFIDKKNKLLTEKSDKLTADAAKVKAHIKLVLQGLAELQHIDTGPQPKPQRGIFT